MRWRCLWTDLRDATRALRRDPWITLAVVVTLGFTIGLNTTIFAFVYGFLFRPLPYPDIEEIVEISIIPPSSSRSRPYLPRSMAELIRKDVEGFTHVAIFADDYFELSSNHTATALQQVPGTYVSFELFDLLRIGPMKGRTFTAEDEQLSRRVALLSHDLWRVRYGQSSDILGDTIYIDNAEYTIVGIMPERFAFYEGSKIWLPYVHLRGRDSLTSVVARLREGITLREVEGRLHSLRKGFRSSHHDEQDEKLWVNTLGSARNAGGMGFLSIPLQGAALIVLLVGCANAATLMILRGNRRSAELAVRSALGATPQSLTRLMFLQNAGLSGLSGVAGAGCAVVGLRLLVILTPLDAAPLWLEFKIDSPVLLLSTLPAVLVVCVFGWWPAKRASEVNVASELQAAGVGTTGTARTGRAARIAVVSATGATLLLLSTSVALFNSTGVVSNYDPTFNPDDVIRLVYLADEDEYNTQVDVRQFYDDLVESFIGLPQVFSVAVEGRPDPDLLGTESWILVSVDEGDSRVLRYLRLHAVSPGYFDTLGIPMLRGSTFNGSETLGTPLVAVVNSAFARLFWPQEDPLGRSVVLGDSVKGTVIGVVESIRIPVSRAGYAAITSDPRIYLPHSQVGGRQGNLFIRSPAFARQSPESILSALARTDSKLLPRRLNHVQDELDATARVLSWLTSVIGGFAAAAWLLAVAGLGGVSALAVIQRTRELGIRRALGATTASIVGLTIKDGVRLALIGIAGGILVFPAVFFIIRRFLYTTNLQVAAILVSTCLAVLLVAGLATLWPAYRAGTVDPLEALKDR